MEASAGFNNARRVSLNYNNTEKKSPAS